MKRHHSFTTPILRKPAIGTSLRVVLLAAFCALALAACNGGESGNGGVSVIAPGDTGGGVAPKGLVFTYPFDGQKNVPPAAAIRLQYQAGIGNSEASKLTLINTGNGQSVAVTPDVSSNGNFVVLETTAALKPATQYSIQRSGQTMVTFTTAPNPGRPSANGFEVVRVSPGGGGIPFVTFNTLHMHFSEAVDPSTIAIGDGFAFTDVGGNQVPGVLYIKGQNLAFDPQDDQLKPGTTYTVTIGPNVKSVFGNSLTANNNSTFDLSPRSPGSITTAALQVVPTPQMGANKVTLSSQLLGVNHLNVKLGSAAMHTVVSQNLIPAPALGGSVMPIAVRRGGHFEVSQLVVKLDGKLPMQLKTGLLRNTFITDLSAWFMGNPYNENGAVNVRMRFDVALSGANDRGNGAVNQNVLNVPAVGTVKTDGNGNLTIDSLGSFVVSVNRTTTATVNFRLHLVTPANGNAPGDTTPPRITAQYPSSCFYTYNTQDFVRGDADGSPAINGEAGSATLADVEADCLDVMANRDLDKDNNLNDDPTHPVIFQEPYANSFPLVASPAITFSEPIDPASLDGNIVLAAAGGSGMPVDANLRVEGSTVVIDPVAPLEAATQYSITVRNGVTDLAGNGMVGNFPGSTKVAGITFQTMPMVVPDTNIGDINKGPVRQTAPFLTLLSPGLPCALDPARGDFRAGGDMAGNCIGDNPGVGRTVTGPFGFLTVSLLDSPKLDYSVFTQPANIPVNAQFSKPVVADSIKLADGCLIGGSGADVASEGSFAVQIMDGSGQCIGVVDGKIAMLTAGAELTRGFTFRPSQLLDSGQRYWIVICGAPNSNEPAAGASQCVTSDKIVDRAGRPLNTNPLYSAGTAHSSSLDAGEAPDGTTLSRCPGRPPVASLPNPTHPLGGTMNCWDQVASGGPDLVMPFDALAPTRDFYAVTRALPTADTNGNGFFDNSSPNVDFSNPPFPALLIGGTNTGEERGRAASFNDALGTEHAQMANSLFVFPTSNGESPMDAGFLSGAQQVAIGTLAAGHDCSAVAEVMLQNGTPNDPSDDVSVTGGVPAHCVPVSLLPGSYKVISTIPAQSGTIATGRILLRFPGADVDGNSVVDHPQKGYIVPECQGVIKTPKRALPAVDVTNPFTNQPDLSTQPVMLEQPFHYAPCFVANLTVTAQTVDVGVPTGLQLISQQDITVQAFGPVAFEQNGRMVISTTNANRFYLQSYMIAMPRVYTFPGRQHLQLVGPAVHGGRAFPATR